MKFDPLLDALNQRHGMQHIHDLGIVDRGRLGYSDYAIAIAIKARADTYHLSLCVEHVKSGSTRTSVIQWPYSRCSPYDLASVLADLRAIEAITPQHPLPDERGWFARGIDAITRTTHLGTYPLKSLLRSPDLPPWNVIARVVRFNGQFQVSLTAYKNPGVLTLASFEQRSLERIRTALEEYSDAASKAELSA